MRILRYLLAVVVGCVALALTVGLAEAVGHGLYPPPPAMVPAMTEFGAALTTNDQPRIDAARAAMGDIVATLPVGALVMVVVGWTLSAVVGGGVAALLAPGLQLLVALLIAGLDAIAILAQCLTIPHPAWMLPVGLVGCFIGGAAVGLCISRWRGRGHGHAVSPGP